MQNSSLSLEWGSKFSLEKSFGPAASRRECNRGWVGKESSSRRGRWLPIGRLDCGWSGPVCDWSVWGNKGAATAYNASGQQGGGGMPKLALGTHRAFHHHHHLHHCPDQLWYLKPSVSRGSSMSDSRTIKFLNKQWFQIQGKQKYQKERKIFWTPWWGHIHCK